MTKYNSNFELSLEDMELIENALRVSKRELSTQLMQHDKVCDSVDKGVRQIHELLGRLHNQKVFFRPQSGSYIGG